MHTVITIGRQFGSAGRLIGKTLANELDIPFYDKELLERAAKDSGFAKEVIKNNDEKATTSFLYSLVMDTYSYGYSSGYLNEMPLNQKVFLAQFESIRKIAEEGPCVIIGRCADYALEGSDNCLSVFIHASIEDRVHRIAAINNLSVSKAKDRIQKADKQRSSYYNYYTNKTWGDTNSYHLSLDSGVLGINGCIEMIKKAIEIKEQTVIQKITKTD